MQQICDGLLHLLHRRSIVHNDLTASNVLLKYNPDMGSKTALICNFKSYSFHPSMEQNIEPECVKPLHKMKTYLPFRVDVSGACKTCSEMLLGLELKEYKSTAITECCYGWFTGGP